MNHQLKTWPEPFNAISDGRKTFEVRSTKDRKFEVGDVLELYRFDPETQEYNGECIKANVRYVLDLAPFGIPNVCAMSIEPYRYYGVDSWYPETAEQMEMADKQAAYEAQKP